MPFCLWLQIQAGPVRRLPVVCWPRRRELRLQLHASQFHLRYQGLCLEFALRCRGSWRRRRRRLDQLKAEVPLAAVLGDPAALKVDP